MMYDENTNYVPKLDHASSPEAANVSFTRQSPGSTRADENATGRPTVVSIDRPRGGCLAWCHIGKVVEPQQEGCPL